MVSIRQTPVPSHLRELTHRIWRRRCSRRGPSRYNPFHFITQQATKTSYSGSIRQPAEMVEKGPLFMRRMLWAFIILSPFIAMAQSYGWPALSVPTDRLAQLAVKKAALQVADAMHAVHALLS
jgi:hypothetical protein